MYSMKKHKMIALMLCIAMVLSFTPTAFADVSVAGETESDSITIEVADFDGLKAALTAGDFVNNTKTVTIMLTANIAADESLSFTAAAGAGERIIDLNGYRLGAAQTGNVFTTNSDLTIKNSKTSNTYVYYKVTAASNSTLILEGLKYTTFSGKISTEVGCTLEFRGCSSSYNIEDVYNLKSTKLPTDGSLQYEPYLYIKSAGNIENLTVEGGKISVGAGIIKTMTVTSGYAELTGGTVSSMTVNGGETDISPDSGKKVSIEALEYAGGWLEIRNYSLETKTLPEINSLKINSDDVSKACITGGKYGSIECTEANKLSSLLKLREKTSTGGNLIYFYFYKDGDNEVFTKCEDKTKMTDVRIDRCYHNFVGDDHICDTCGHACVHPSGNVGAKTGICGDCGFKYAARVGPDYWFTNIADAVGELNTQLSNVFMYLYEDATIGGDDINNIDRSTVYIYLNSHTLTIDTTDENKGKMIGKSGLTIYSGWGESASTVGTGQIAGCIEMQSGVLTLNQGVTVTGVNDGTNDYPSVRIDDAKNTSSQYEAKAVINKDVTLSKGIENYIADGTAERNLTAHLGTDTAFAASDGIAKTPSEVGTGFLGFIKTVAHICETKDSSGNCPICAKTVTQKTNSWTRSPSITGWKQGSTPNAPNAVAKYGTVKVEYKLASEEDTAYTETVPAIAGDYKVRFTVAEADGYTGLEKIVNLKITANNPCTTHSNISFTANNTNHTITGKCLTCGNQLGTVTLSASSSYTYDKQGKPAALSGSITDVTAPTIAYSRVVNGSESNLNSTPVNAGTYKASITLGTGSGKASVSVVYTITKAEMNPSWENSEKAVAYTGKPIEASAISRIEPNLIGSDTLEGEIAYTYRSTASDGAYEEGLPTEVGTYSIKASIPEQPNYSAADVPGSLTLTVSYLSTGAAAVLKDQAGNIISGDSRWAKKVTFAAPDGFSISKDAKGVYETSFDYDTETDESGASVTYYLKNANGEIAQKSAKVYVDRSIPTWKQEDGYGITIAENSYKSLLNTISFGHLYKNNIDVKIRALDEESGVASYYYYIDNSGSTSAISSKELEALTFTKYDCANQEAATVTTLENANETKKYVIYAYAVDKAGNRSAYICSKGVIVDDAKPQLSNLTTPSKDNGTLTGTQAVFKFTASEAGTYFYTVTNGSGAFSALTDLATEDVGNGLSEWQAKSGISSGEMTVGVNTVTLSLAGMEANTEYYIYVSAADKAGNGATGVISDSFTTLKKAAAITEQPELKGTYGQKASEMDITGGNVSFDGNKVEGSWSVTDTNMDDIPSVGTSQKYEVTFTPTDSVYDDITIELIPTVAKKKVTVTADNKERKYGEANPEFTFTITTGSLIGSDTKTDLGVVLSCEADGASPVTTDGYAITGTSNSASYDVTITSGVLTINKADAQISGTAEYTKNYGDSAFALDAASNHSEAKLTYVVSGSKDSSGAAAENDKVVTVDENGNVTVKGAGSATVTISQAASTNYNAAQDKRVEITVNRHGDAPNMPELTMKAAARCKTVGALELPEGWAWNSEDSTKELKSGETVSARAEYIGEGSGSYAVESVTVEITRAYSGGAPLLPQTPSTGADDTQQPGDAAGESGQTGQPTDAEQAAEIKAIKEKVSAMSLNARSSKTVNGNIKITLRMNSETESQVKAIEDMGYAVKYKFYRSTKKSAKYGAKVSKTSKTYVNTFGANGTMYYYKARIQVYDKDGKLIAQSELKQCRYANRAWTK